jgi:hypothetical protein
MVAGVADTCRASIRAAVTMRVSRISVIPTGMPGCSKNAAITRRERVSDRNGYACAATTRSRLRVSEPCARR